MTDLGRLIGDFSDRRDMLLLEYACGALDEAASLMVASWLTFSAEARAVVASYEMLGGTLMCQTCQPIRMEESSLRNVLDRLGIAAHWDQPRDNETPCRANLPLPLHPYAQQNYWQPMGHGVRILSLSLPAVCTHALADRIGTGRAIHAVRL